MLWMFTRDWSPKVETGLNVIIGIDKRLCFCQNDALLVESFWQKESIVTLILFELCLFWYLAQLQI